MKKILYILAFIFFGLFGIMENGYCDEATYTVSTSTSVNVSGTTPTGSSTTFSGTGTLNGGFIQCTNGKSHTLTLHGYVGCTITGIVINVKSNTSKGTGSFLVKAGSEELAKINESAFNSSNWNGAWSTSGVNKTLTMINDNYKIKENEDVTLTISCKSGSKDYNSLYISSYNITYTTESSKFTLTYKHGIETYEDEYDSNENVTVKRNMFSNPGHIFDSWVDNNGNYFDEYTQFEIIKDTIFNANWIENLSSFSWYESFNKNDGAGGNDEHWSGTFGGNEIAKDEVDYDNNFDNDGFTGEKVFIANKCIKIGSGSYKGHIKTPNIEFDGSQKLKLLFKAASWNGSSENTNIKIIGDGVSLDTTITLIKGKWMTYSIQLNEFSSSSFNIKWEAENKTNNRFFLDEICILSIKNQIEVITWNKDSIFISQDYFNEIDFEPTNIRVKNLDMGVNKKTSLDERIDGTLHAEFRKLDTLECQTLNFIVSNATSGLEYQIKIPIFVGANHIVDNEDCDVVILVDSIFTPSDGIENKDVIVYPKGTLVIPNGATYNANSLTLRRDNDDAPQFKYNGTLNTDKLYFELRTDGTDWRWLTLPDTFNTELVNEPSEVVVKYYDGSIRAFNGKGGWQEQWWNNSKHYTNKFAPGEGCIFGIDIPNVSEKHIYQIPLSADSLKNEKSNKRVGIHANKGTSGHLNDYGWNLVGNPYMLTYNIGNEFNGVLQTDSLIKEMNNNQWTGRWIPSGNKTDLRYIVIPSWDTQEEIDAGGYKQVCLQNGYSIKPFTSFFIQANNDGVLEFNNSHKASAPSRMKSNTNKEVFLQINVGSIKTGCYISNKFTDDYEIGDDMESLYSTYQLINNYKLLYSAINDSIIEHGIQVHGTGLVSLDDKTNVSDFDEINIFYNEHWYNLLNGDTPNVQGDFILFAKRNKNDIPTGPNETIINEGVKKFIYNDNVYILRENEVYNILGAKIR